MPFAPPLDFRYVALTPAPPSRRWVWALLSGTSGLALATLSLAHHLPGGGVFALAAGTGGLLTAYLVHVQRGRLAEGLESSGRWTKRGGASPTQVAMAIVPWGVLLSPDTDDERVLRWAAIREVAVAWVHERGVDGIPSTRESVVTIATETECLQGRAPGHVALERLQARFDEYRAEASRPLALDWSGDLIFEDAGASPIVSLLDATHASLSEPNHQQALRLESMSYRADQAPRPSARTELLLREVLAGSGPSGVDVEPTDRRALAALLAGELGMVGLLPTLRRLVLSVHPVLAACAKAAALRLGAEPTQVGALDEITPFLSDDDLRLLSEWVSTKPPSCV